MNRIRKIRLEKRLKLEDIQFHGAYRLADGKSRWYWVPSMFVLLVCASALIYLTVERFHDNPTFMIQWETNNLVLKFPSVIICPEIEFDKHTVEQFLSAMNYPDDINKTYIYSVLPQLAAFYAPDVLYKNHDLVNLENFLNYNNMDVETAGRKLTRTCEETLIRCRWDDTYFNCSNIFTMELTGDGFCCVFNGRSLRREMKEHVKLRFLNRRKRWQTEFVGFRSGLILAVNQSQKPLNIDISYKWISLQGAQRYVDTSLNGTALNPGSEQWMIYHMRTYKISDDAKGLRSSLRRCYLPDQSLKYFSEYKRKYCILECEMANTIKKCNCVRLVHPQPRGVRYCGAKDHACAQHAMVAYGFSCECLPTCRLESNDITTTSFSLDSSVVPLDHFYKGLNYDKVTIIRVFIQTFEQWTFQRSSYFSYLELFSQLGGMFNVFFGVSILTILGMLQFALKFAMACIKI